MAGRPAARVGDLCTPPHTPSALGPGIGAINVHIGGKPAWRCNLDTHVCALPIAPPAPAPHGPEICYFGSMSVMIGGQMAVRVGDQLMGAGGPNPVVLGMVNVLIGDMGFGLADPANMAEFCADFAQLQNDWPSLTPAQRRERLEDITNKQLNKSGVPNQRVMGSSAHAPGNAQYDFQNSTLDISMAQLNSPTLSGNSARQLANATYHEARHAEQWFLMARREASRGQNASQIASRMGVPNSFAQAATNAPPLTRDNPARNLANSSWNSVYGSRGSYRNDVLNNINTRYPEYRALPEEQDAWNTGDGLPCG